MRVGVLEIVGKAGDAREFVPGRRVEISIATSSVDRAVSEPYIGNAQRIIITNGDIAGGVSHVIVGAMAPQQLRKRCEVAIRDKRAFKDAAARHHNRSGYRG